MTLLTFVPLFVLPNPLVALLKITKAPMPLRKGTSLLKAPFWLNLFVSRIIGAWKSSRVAPAVRTPAVPELPQNPSLPSLVMNRTWRLMLQKRRKVETTVLPVIFDSPVIVTVVKVPLTPRLFGISKLETVTIPLFPKHREFLDVQVLLLRIRAWEKGMTRVPESRDTLCSLLRL